MGELTRDRADSHERMLPSGELGVVHLAQLRVPTNGIDGGQPDGAPQPGRSAFGEAATSAFILTRLADSRVEPREGDELLGALGTGRHRRSHREWLPPALARCPGSS